MHVAQSAMLLLSTFPSVSVKEDGVGVEGMTETFLPLTVVSGAYWTEA